MKIIAIAAMALCLAAAPPAFARQDAEAAETVAQVDGGLKALAVHMAPYNALYSEFLEVISDMALRYEEADALAARKASQQEIQAWMDGWLPETRKTIAGYSRRLDEAKGDRKALQNQLAVFGADGARMVRAADGMPARIRPIIQLNSKLVEQVAVLAPRVAAGDEAANQRLAMVMLSGSAAALRAENALLEFSIEAYPNVNLERRLAVSLLASNKAVIELLDLTDLLINERKFDEAAVARRMHNDARDARSANSDLRRGIDRMSEQARDAPPEAAQFVKKILDIVSTFKDSVAVEDRVADGIDKMADSVGALDIEGALNIFTGLESLLGRREELQKDRQAISAQ